MCGCEETYRTGIPCCHILTAARATPGTDYLQFFRKRWIMEIPTPLLVPKEKKNLVRLGRPRKTHRKVLELSKKNPEKHNDTNK